MGNEQKPPENTIQFIVFVVKSIIGSIPQIIKGTIISAVISFIVANAIHFYLMGWVNDGWNPSNDPVINALIFVNGQETSPKVMLFYFLISYIFWWILGMFRTRGVPATIKLIATTPIWVGRSLMEAGIASFALLMGGVTVSFIIGFTLLTGPSSIMMFLMTITWLVTQEQSLMVLGLQFGIKDISSLANKDQPPRLPDKSLPVVGILGAALGFAYMTFLTPNTTGMLVFIVLTIAGVGYMMMQNRKKQAAVMAALFIIIASAAILAPMCLADDGGIKENGGWSSITGGTWLRDALISRGMPASAVAVLGALLASFVSPPSVWGSVDNLPSDLGHTYSGATRTRGVVDYPTQEIRDAAGNVTGFTQTGRGLPQSIIDAEDSDNFGNAIRVYTQPVPQDQSLMDDITEGIADLGTEVTNQLHPDVWKNLTHEERSKVMEQVNEVLNDELGTDHGFTTFSNPNRRGLYGNYNPNTNKINLNTSSTGFDDPREALRTLIHEARHSYQLREADANGNDYEQMSNYSWNNYTSSTNDYVAYGEQFIERDSRNFSSNTTNQVIDALNRAAREQ